MKTLLTLALGALIAVPALAQKMDNADEAALKQMAQSSLTEIQAGKLGASKAKDAEVKKFAQKMVDDHELMLRDLRTLAKSKGVALPQDPNAREFVEMKKLEHAAADDFDRRYMDHMVKDHEKEVQATANLAAKAKDAQFKAAVQHANEKIKEHLQLARSVAGKLK